MYEIIRPQLLETIRDSILKNKITCIYGEAAIGKTVILKRCLNTFFFNRVKNFIGVYANGSFNINMRNHKLLIFNEGIHIFEDFDNYCDSDKNWAINEIVNNSSDDTKFVIVSRRKIEFLQSINNIYIPPFSLNETAKFLYEFNNKINSYLVNEIFYASKGNPLLIELIIKLLLKGEYSFDDISKIIYTPCIVDKYGVPIEKIDKSTQIIITEINDQLLYEFAKNPELLHNLSSYDFERVIARIFEKQGFSVEITPRTRDGGKDIFIAKQGLASFLFYVECKKYAPNKPVGIDIIQRLYGVICAEKANGGFIATTSHFTKPAKDYIKEYNLEHQLTLQDYNTISDILKSLQHNTQ